jgi:LEA14-like dessication related protein
MLGKNKNLILFGTATIIVSGVAIYLYRQYSFLMDSFKNGFKVISGVVIKKIDAKEINFTLIFKITNAGDLGITVKNQVYDVYINNTRVSTITNKTPLKIKANSVTSFPLDININPTDLSKVLNINTLLAGMSNKNKLIFRVNGMFSFSAGMLKIKDFTFEQTFTLADLMTPSENTTANVKNTK